MNDPATSHRWRDCEARLPEQLRNGGGDDGQLWVCTCGRLWRHDCDEAEGCSWLPVEKGDQHVRLTTKQREVWAVIPWPPDDGRGLKGPRLRAARGLESLGLVRVVGANPHTGRVYYVRNIKRVDA